jgi:hypothetical protein
VATETPLPTYAAQASPPSGIYVIPAVELMPTSDAFDWYACAELAATPSTRERTCEVK